MVSEKGLRERICRKVSESLVYLCIFVHFSLGLVSRFKSGKGGVVAVKYTIILGVDLNTLRHIYMQFKQDS